ncbi:Uncharacterised protein [Legionella steigerwaltii]|uniref:Uncharacterized protein n=1 Tax=Legionella steigerwaltii TaxID=460 RepID=A0A378LIA9_9GAMM|nr:hypothetical protein [Legionella steigerwaltii]KTD71673.1 hypothetical protein Lstg_2881 [Legionella steigerwaltii]STY23841.1 Uncharacterised protein [Legionella steigerwaltii]
MRIHWFFKTREVNSIDDIIDTLGEQKNLSQLVNFFEQTLKQHPSVMSGIYRAPQILVSIMNRIHEVFTQQKKDNTQLNEIADQEELLWPKPWQKYPSYNDMKGYLELLKSVITPSSDILLTSTEDSDEEEESSSKPDSLNMFG